MNKVHKFLSIIFLGFITVAEFSVAQDIETALRSDNERQTVTPTKSAEETIQPENTLWPAETGTATFYATGMEGRLTASGEPYDPEQLTAAHRTLPIGSLVRVTHLKSNHQVVLCVSTIDGAVEGIVLSIYRGKQQ